MAKNIFNFEGNDFTTKGRSVGAIKRPRFRLSVLKALLELGQDKFHTVEELYSYLEKRINLTNADKTLVEDKKYTEFEYRLDRNISQLYKAELLEKDSENKSNLKISANGFEFLKKLI